MTPGTLRGRAAGKTKAGLVVGEAKLVGPGRACQVHSVWKDRILATKPKVSLELRGMGYQNRRDQGDYAFPGLDPVICTFNICILKHEDGSLYNICVTAMRSRCQMLALAQWGHYNFVIE